jgi:hypothetical protein
MCTDLSRQSTAGRLWVYEDVEDAERLAYDAELRVAVDRTDIDHQGALTSQMGRFETGCLLSEANPATMDDTR